MAKAKICVIEGCCNPAGVPGSARGMCRAHYRRWYRHGDPLAGATGMNARPNWIEKNKGYTGDDCLVWPFSKTPSGYGQIKISGKSTLASHAMCIAAHGPAPKAGMQAAHSCGNGHLGCVNPRHLRWATRKENMADAKQHGTWAHGEKQGGSKLTREQVEAIRTSAETHQALADRHGIARQTVTKIKAGKLWAWLE